MLSTEIENDIIISVPCNVLLLNSVNLNETQLYFLENIVSNNIVEKQRMIDALDKDVVENFKEIDVKRYLIDTIKDYTEESIKQKGGGKKKKLLSLYDKENLEKELYEELYSLQTKIKFQENRLKKRCKNNENLECLYKKVAINKTKSKNCNRLTKILNNYFKDSENK